MDPKLTKEREAQMPVRPNISVSVFSASLKPISLCTLSCLLVIVSAAPVGAQQNYCLDAYSGQSVPAGATIKQGNQLMRCCRMAPISGAPSNAAFLQETQFKKILNPHRCWSGGLRTRDFVSVKIPDHPRRGRRLGR